MQVNKNRKNYSAMALKNFIFTVLIANLITLTVVPEAHSYNDITGRFYKTDYVNNHDKNNPDAQEELPVNIAKKLVGFLAKEIAKESHNYEQLYSEGNNKNVDLQTRFIFPDEMLRMRQSDNSRDLLIPKLDDCGAQTFCENVTNYPQTFMDQLVLNNSTLKNFAIQDAIPIKSRAYVEEDQLCATEEKLIHPRAARNMQDETLFIIQSNTSRFYQAVRVETCRQENTECKLIDFPPGYVMTCKQKYIYRQLLAVKKTGEVIPDFFQLPASCCCQSKFDPQSILKNVRQRKNIG